MFNSDTAKAAGSKSSRKGVENKASKDLRQVVKDLLESNAEQLANDFKTLEGKDRLTIAIKLLDFVIPKLQSQKHETQAETIKQEIVIHFTQDDMKSDPIC